MPEYKHIFFDLDRTLWDFDANSAQTLLELIAHFDLSEFIPDEKEWVNSYVRHNMMVWNLYEDRQISKHNLRIERFRLLLKDFSINKIGLVDEISNYYITHSPHKSTLMPGVKEVLEYLIPKYKLYILSNGFYDIQLQKLEAGGIGSYFDKVFTSDVLNVAKPHRKVFEESVKAVNARKKQSVFIGDNLENDVVGPKKFGMDQIWYNHDNIITDVIPTYEIKSLIELKDIL